VAPLVRDAPHDLGKEGWKRNVSWPRPVTGKNSNKRFVEKIRRFATTDTTDPGLGECRKSQQIRLPLTAEQPSDFLEREMFDPFSHEPCRKSVHLQCGAGR
jgi:hypothetical protein